MGQLSFIPLFVACLGLFEINAVVRFNYLHPGLAWAFLIPGIPAV
tara:strand:+ start:4470 stop:4604 length:135 start_codon:yes stop_codon:yes gene_type:complete